jgi:hypothetical protein
MANNPIYSNSADIIKVLKELYDGETEEDRLLREFTNHCAKVSGLPETPAPHTIPELLYAENPFFKLIENEKNSKA